MDMSRVAEHGLVLLGCGKMGSAMLAGWLEHGLPASSVWVIDPYPSDWLKAQGVHINTTLPEAPAVVLVAVKPQMMGDALPAIQALGGGGSLFVSVAAGTSIATFEDVLGAGTPIVRAMPNTPAAHPSVHACRITHLQACRRRKPGGRVVQPLVQISVTEARLTFQQRLRKAGHVGNARVQRAERFERHVPVRDLRSIRSVPAGQARIGQDGR